MIEKIGKWCLVVGDAGFDTMFLSLLGGITLQLDWLKWGFVGGGMVECIALTLLMILMVIEG